MEKCVPGWIDKGFQRQYRKMVIDAHKNGIKLQRLHMPQPMLPQPMSACPPKTIKIEHQVDNTNERQIALLTPSYDQTM